MCTRLFNNNISSVSGESCHLVKDSKVLKYQTIGMVVVLIDFYSYLFSVHDWLKSKSMRVSTVELDFI